MRSQYYRGIVQATDGTYWNYVIGRHYDEYVSPWGSTDEEIFASAVKSYPHSHLEALQISKLSFYLKLSKEIHNHSIDEYTWNFQRHKTKKKYVVKARKTWCNLQMGVGEVPAKD